MELHLLLLGVITALGFTVGSAAGFGSSVVILTLGVHLFPLDLLVPVVVLLNQAMGIYLAVRYRKSIEMRLLLTRILPLAGIGLPIGFLVFHFVDIGSLKMALGGFVLVLAVLETVRLVRTGSGARVHPLPPWATVATLLGGGVLHGLWAAGGPPTPSAPRPPSAPPWPGCGSC
jgi:hypothetical protein